MTQILRSGLIGMALILSACMASQSVGPGGIYQGAGPAQQRVGPGGVEQSGPGARQSVRPGCIEQSAPGARQQVGACGDTPPAPAAKPNACSVECKGGRYQTQCPAGTLPVCRCEPEPGAYCRA